MGWIIEKLIGATFPGAGLLLKLATGIKGGIDWTFANTKHLLIVALALAVAGIFYERHEDHKHVRAMNSALAALDSEKAAHKSDNALWARSFATEQRSFQTVLSALNEQNTAVANLKATADKKAAANRAALQSLSQRLQGAEALSDRMKAAFASSGAQAGKNGQCASDRTVLDAAKGGAL